MQIERRQELDEADFIEGYLQPGRPVVITDAMDVWANRQRFTPERLRAEFGDLNVQVYNDLFDLVNIMTLSEYLAGHFNKSGDEPSREYVRWYTKLKDVDFLWADEVFERLEEAWDNPYFLPTHSYAIPFCPASERISPVTHRFPYKGLFISGKGARTRLHRDPWNSNAILCQFYGEKKITLYAPDQQECVMNGEAFVDPADPDLARFPLFSKATPAFEDTLEPGEIAFFPSGWFHDVTSISDSVSITWNMVHVSNLKAFEAHVAQYPAEGELEIARFFLRPWLSSNVSGPEIVSFLESRLA